MNLKQLKNIFLVLPDKNHVFYLMVFSNKFSLRMNFLFQFLKGAEYLGRGNFQNVYTPSTACDANLDVGKTFIITGEYECN